MTRAAPKPRFVAWEWPTALLALSLLALFFRSVPAFVRALDQCDLLLCDFVGHYRPMGRDLFVLRRPDPEFFYPPFAALFFAPFGALPPRAAEAVWGACLVGSAAVLVHLPATRLVFDRPLLRALAGFLVPTSLAVMHGFKWGQVSPLLTALALLALVWRDEGRLVAPAALLSLAVSIKVYPALVLLVPLLRRDLRLLGATALGTAVCSLVLPALVLGPHDAWAFFIAASEQADGALERWVWLDKNSQYLPHVVGRALGMPQLGREPFLRAMAALLALLSLLSARAVLRSGTRHATFWGFTWCLGAAPLLLQTSWPHYFAWLPPAQILVASALGAPLSHARRALGWVALGASMALGAWSAAVVLGSFAAVATRGVLLGSHLLLLLAAGIALARNRAPV